MKYTFWLCNMCTFLTSMPLHEFIRQWNHHGIRTVVHQTPLALWYTGLLTVPEESVVTNWQTYRIDYDGPLTDIETDNNVVLPES